MTLPPDEVIRIAKMIPSIREFRLIDIMRDYRAVRNNYFGNRIPPIENVIVSFFPDSEMTRIGEAEDTCGLCMWGRLKGIETPMVILLSESGSICETRIRLIHEMCHLSINLKHNRDMGHGKHWKAEMQRLAKLGSFDNWW